MDYWLLFFTGNRKAKLKLFFGSHAPMRNVTQSICFKSTAIHKAKWIQISSVTGINNLTQLVCPYSAAFTNGEEYSLSVLASDTGISNSTQGPWPCCAAAHNAALDMYLGLEIGDAPPPQRPLEWQHGEAVSCLYE